MAKRRRRRKPRKKRKGCTRHHIVNKVFGGKGDVENIIWLHEKRHDMWHRVFNNLNFLQVAMILVRANNMVKGTNLTITEVD